MKLLYKFFMVVAIVGSSFCQASSGRDRDFVEYLIQKGDFEAARVFLSRFVSGERKEGEEGPALAAVPVDEIRYAQRRVLPADQITLAVADILAVPCVNPRDVFEIDLTDMVAAHVGEVQAYFKDQPFCNLRCLRLPAGDLAHDLVDAIFTNDDAQRKYISLHHIVAPNNNFMEADLDRVFEHFSGYKDFVRDMSQISGRYDCVAAFLAVNGAHLADGSEYARGRKDEGGHTIHYRVGEASTENAPFIMSARPFR
jgi:hypothetical protein